MNRKLLLALIFLVVSGRTHTAYSEPLPTNPTPFNGTGNIVPDAILTWTPGDFVGGYVEGKTANGHHVFIHTNQTWVEGAAISYPLGSQYGHFRADTNEWSPLDPSPFGYAAALKPDKMYYWRVIEVNQANEQSPFKGDMWSFTILAVKAANPTPAPGQIVGLDVGDILDVQLTWQPGAFAGNIDSYEVFLGTDQAAVTDATPDTPLDVYMGPTTDPCYPANDLALDITYYWRVDEVNDYLGTFKGDVWNFITDSGFAKQPSPPNNTTDVDPDTQLSWTAGFAAATHDVYLGTAPGALDPLVLDLTDTNYPVALDINTTYYWRVDEVNESHSKSPWMGNLWTFTTHSGQAEGPYPVNEQTGVRVNTTTLSWTAAPRAVSHDVYFGTTTLPPFIRNQTATTYDPGRLEYAATYYWRIDERQDGDFVVPGEPWTFYTPSGPPEVNVVLDETVKYQKIDGFGAHGAMNVWWSSGPFYNQQFLDRVIDDLGLTITRNEYYPKPDEPGQWPKQIPYLQALKAKAEASGEPLKFVATYWSPPAWMKTNLSTKNGGTVPPEHYEDLGNYAVQTIQDYKDIGIDLYALSLQNEPGWPQPYNSCTYSHEGYPDMLKVVGPIVDTAFPSTKLFMCEHMLENQIQSFASFEHYIIQDPNALQWADIWAQHGSDGFAWSKAWDRFGPTGRPVWMSETSGYNESWTDCMDLAESIYAALKIGHASAWIWWQISENNGYGNPPGQYVLMNVGVPGKRYYISKHYYRYIRPEAFMVECDSDDADVLAAAFTHDQQKTVTLVLVNTSQLDEKLVSIDVAGLIRPAVFDIYRTSPTEDCVHVGTVGTGGSVLLPESTITTLYGVTTDTLGFEYFADFAQQWHRDDCGPGNDWCSGADSTGDGYVLVDDLNDLFTDWLLRF